MPKLPGRFDGQMHEDLRLLHLGLRTIFWYVDNGLWDRITKVNSGDVTVSVWLNNGIKHSWRSQGYREPMLLTETLMRTGERLRTYPVRLPDHPVPTLPTHEELCEMIRRRQAQKGGV